MTGELIAHICHVLAAESDMTNQSLHDLLVSSHPHDFTWLGQRVSLCAGYGELDLRIQFTEPGFHTRCFVEIDPDAQAASVAGMAVGYLPRLAEHRPGHTQSGETAAPRRRARSFWPASVWDNVRTFAGDSWRGHIDTILTGHPCQPSSAAGQRCGEYDERYL